MKRLTTVMRRVAGLVIGVGTALAAGAFPVLASDVIVLKQGVGGYKGCADTYIDYSNPTANYGSLWYMHLYMSSHRPRRSAPVRFDLTGIIPPGQIIESATLSLWVYQVMDMTGNDWISVGPYRVHGTRNWAETGATWNCFVESTYWAMPGCEDPSWDRLSSPDSRQYFYNTSAVNCYYHWDVTASVQAWYGGVDGLSFNAKESGSDACRPYLTIVYSPQAVPTERSSWGDVKRLFR